MRWWPFGRRRELRQQMSLAQLLAEQAPTTWAGVPVDADQAMRLSTVWACVRLLADSVSTLPVDVFRRGERQPLPPPPLLRRPAAHRAMHEWLEAAMRSLLLRGNAYGIVVARGADLRPTQVELAHPDRVSVRVNAEGMVEYRLGGRPYPREDVWHLRAYAMPGLMLGLSPVEYARQTIGLGLAAEKFGAQWFGEGAVPAGLLETDADLQPEQAYDLKAQWKARHRNHHDIAVLDNGAKYKPITIAPEESQFIQTQQLNTAAIARIFGVPAEMIGGDPTGSHTYTSTEQRSTEFVRYTLRPWLHRLETAIGALLPRDQYVKFNAGALLRATTLERYQAHEIALRAGFLTVDEVRELEDRPPLETAA
jgi:HK97 family phage portal protein